MAVAGEGTDAAVVSEGKPSVKTTQRPRIPPLG